MEKKALKIEFLDDVKLQLIFQDGKIIQYDLENLFSIYPPFEELKKNRELFLKGKLSPNGWMIIWDDDLDLETLLVYEEGQIVGQKETSINNRLGALLNDVINKSGYSQSEVARMSGIDQADIWRMVSGKGNPTLAKIDKVFKALGVELKFKAK